MYIVTGHNSVKLSMGIVHNCSWKTNENFQVFDYWAEFDSMTQKHSDSVLNKSLTHD